MDYAFFARGKIRAVAMTLIAALVLLNPAFRVTAATVVFNDSFDSVPDNEIPTGFTESGNATWGAFNLGEGPGVVLYGDIENYDPYGNNISADLISPTINLNGATSASIAFSTRCDTEYTPPEGGDYMALKFSSNGSAFAEAVRWNEESIDDNDDPSDIAVKSMSVPIPSEYFTDAFKFAFSWNTNASEGSTDGCYIDDVSISADGEISGGGDGGGDDTTPPTVTINTPQNGSTVAPGSLSVSAATNETAVSCEVTVSGGSSSALNDAGSGMSWSGSVTVEVGSATIAVSCSDTAGNIGNASVGVTVSTENGGGDGGGSDPNILFMEDFETTTGIPSGWIHGGSQTFGSYDSGSEPGIVLYGDIQDPPYRDNVTSTLTLPPINASSAEQAIVSVDTRCDTEYSNPASGDSMAIFASSNGTDFTELARWNEFSLDDDGIEGDFVNGTITANIPANLLTDALTLRLLWSTNASNQGGGDGCFINDLTVETSDSGGGGDTPIGVSACTTLAESGRTYELLNNLSSNTTCLIVTGSNITIDGNGRTINGNGTEEQYGISIEAAGANVSGVTITNFYGGIYGTNAHGAEISNVMLSGNTYGLLWRTGTDLSINSITANNNTDSGIYLDSVSGSTIDTTTTNGNNVGIYLLESSGNTLTNNTAENNDRGLLLIQSSDNTIEDAVVKDNEFGLAFEIASFENTVNGLTAEGNGTGLSIGSRDNTITDAVLTGNTNRGVRFFDGDASGTTLKSVSVSLGSSGSTDLVMEAEDMSETVFDTVALGSYSISGEAFLTIRNTNGTVTLNQPVSGSGAWNDQIAIRPLKVTLGESSGFSGGGTITLNNLPLGQTGYDILKDGESCSECTPTALLGSASAVTFAVSGPGTYEITWEGKIAGDETAPVVTVNSPTATTFAANEEVVFEVSLNEGGSCTLETTGSSETALSASNDNTLFTGNRTFAQNGTITATIRCTDLSGNPASPAVLTFTITGGAADTTPPQITIVAPEDGASVEAGSVSIGVLTNEDVESCSVSVNGGDLSALSGSDLSWNGTLSLTAGSATITISCTDAAGNTGNASSSLTVTAETGGGTTPPFISDIRITTPVTGAIVGTTTMGYGYTVRWNSNVPLFDIYLTSENGAIVRELATSTPGTNFGGIIPSYNFVPSRALTPGTYVINIRSDQDETVQASSSPFVIQTDPATIIVVPGPVNGPSPSYPPLTVGGGLNIIQLSGTITAPLLLSSATSTATHVLVPLSAEGAGFRLADFTATSTGTLGLIFGRFSLLATTTEGLVGMYIQAGTEVTDRDWDGVLYGPRAASTSGIDTSLTSTLRANIDKAISLGSNAKLFFSKAIRIFIEGAADREVGYIEGSTITPIDSNCSADTEAAGNTLERDGDCRIDSGDDLIIWTKHLTTFVTYSTETIPNNTSSGGSSGGGSSGGSSALGNGPILTLQNVGPIGTNQTSLLGDLSGDGVLDERDIDAFISLLKTPRENEADLDQNGVVDIRDFNLLMTLF